MRRTSPIDRLLLGTLLPLGLACVGLSVDEGLRSGQLRFPLIPRSAETSSAYPTVWEASWAEDPQTSGLRAGDRLLRVGEADLRGLTAGGVMVRLLEAGRETGAVDVTFEREGRPATIRIEAQPKRDWWTPLPFSVACIAAVVLILLRRPDWFLARRAFLAGSSAAIGFLHYFGLRVASAYAAAFALVIAVPCATALGLEIALAMPAPRPRRRGQRLLPWLWACLYGAQFAAVIWCAPPLSLRAYLALRAGLVGGWFAALALAARAAYRRADAVQRRQLRWIGYGLYVGAIPLVAAFALHAVGIPPELQRVAYAVGAIALVAMPLGIVVAMVWFDWLDVDRLISATTSYTIVAAALGVALLSATPPLAGAASATLGVSPAMAQFLVASVFAVVLVPGHRRLRPHLDRLFFAEHHALEQGVDRLLHDLGQPTTLAALVDLVGARLSTLLRVDSVAIYARETEVFVPVFARGVEAPPPLPARDPLAVGLEARATPVAAALQPEASTRGGDPLGRAALEALGAAAVVPIRRGERLAAFVALGAKRSGDVFTSSDVALLTAVSSRLSERLARIDQAELLGEAHALQASLRRYVPEAVAARVERGEEAQVGEREVTVLFVDIRGYTGIAEGLAAPDIFATVNRYTERVSGLVARHGGAVVEFHGDGLLAVFGAPEPLLGKERAAVAAGREIVVAVGSMAREEGERPLAVGIGIATGPAFVGNVRGHDREIWSVIGNTTNLAARLQALTRELGAAIALDGSTRNAAQAQCTGFVESPQMPVRGRSTPVDVWFLPEPSTRV